MKTLTKSNLTIGKISDANEVLIGEDVTCAQNGKILIEVTRPEIHYDEFPAIDNFGPMQSRAFVIDSKDALEIAKKIPSKKSYAPIIKQAIVSQNDNTDIATTDSQSSQITRVKETGKRFPEYKEVIPSGENTTLKIGLSTDLLGEICKHASGFCDDEYRALTFEFINESSAVKITTKNYTTGQKFTSIIMPMDLK